MTLQPPSVILDLEIHITFGDLIGDASKCQAFLDHQGWKLVRSIKIVMEETDIKEPVVSKAQSSLDEIP